MNRISVREQGVATHDDVNVVPVSVAHYNLHHDINDAVPCRRAEYLAAPRWCTVAFWPRSRECLMTRLPPKAERPSYGCTSAIRLLQYLWKEKCAQPVHTWTVFS